MPGEIEWEVSGDYFENCNCDVVCPCLVSTAAPLTSNPTQGDCDVVLVFHVDKGRYGDVTLDGLNAVLIGKSNGPMANGNLTGAAYIDERADEKQAEALDAIFSGAAGGPMAALAPLFSTNLGAKKARITYTASEGRRAAEIPDILSLRVKALPSLVENREIWMQSGHPVNPDKLALAVGEEGNTYADYEFRWDNSGRNAHYASIHWTN